MHRIIIVIALCLSGLVHAQEKRRSPEQVWNELFDRRQKLEYQHNKFLETAVKGRQPGKALDIGMGQGRNSIFLAAQGWDVTGFDIAEVGVKLAREEAKKKGLNLQALVGDVDKFDYGRERWDLVVGMYMHEYVTRNAKKIVDSLKPGGILVIEGIHRDINRDSLSGGRYGHRNNELPKQFDRLRIKYYEDVLAVGDWEKSGGTPVPVVRMIAVKEQSAR